jgi:hypothetical protein
MMWLAKKVLKKIKLFVLYWTRIVFVKNNFDDIPITTKIKANAEGYLADQYILYDFKHVDKKDYLSEFDWYRSRYINEPFDFSFNNKVVCAEMLKHHIRFAENYYIINKHVLLDFHHGPMKYEDVMATLEKEGKLVVKPFAMGKGNGVHLLTFENGRYYVDTEEYTYKNLVKYLKKLDGYLISEYIHQHEYSNKLYDRTTNTIRFITMRNTKTHEMELFFAVQRIGRFKTIPVDNGSKGGLVANINLETGELSEARCLQELGSWDVHPDSGNPIKGAFIPNWDGIKKEMLDVCKKIPFMDFIAWDLLIMEDGRPCVIEANTSSGVNIIQLWGGQKQDELGDFFRHYGVIK